MQWIKWDGQILIRGNYLVTTEDGAVTVMRYAWNALEKTNKGSAPRWEWNNRISPWKVTHYMRMPSPPTPSQN